MDPGFLDGEDVDGVAAGEGQDFREAGEGGNVEGSNVDGIPSRGGGARSHEEAGEGPAGKPMASMRRRARA